MRPDRPIRLLFSLAGLVVGVGAIVSLAAYLQPAASFALNRPERQKSVLQVIRSEDLSFLVSEKIVTQVVVEQEQSSLLWGRRDGYLIATATLYYGIDLSQLDERSVEQTPQGVVVRLPRPSLLDVAVDPDYEFFSKKSGLVALRDWMAGADLERTLRMRVQDEAEAFAAGHDLLPDDRRMLERLNRFADSLAVKLGRPLRFAYRKTGEASGASE